MRAQDLLKYVEQKWHKAFIHFVNTGEGNDEFLEYVDNNKEIQSALEIAFKGEAEAIKEVAKELAGESKKAEASQAATAISSRMTRSLLEFMKLPYGKRHSAYYQLNTIFKRLGKKKREKAVSIVKDIEQNLTVPSSSKDG